MALRQLCPTLISARIPARQSCVGRPQSCSRQGPGKNALSLYKLWSGIGFTHGTQFWRTHAAERLLVLKAALDDVHDQNNSSERTESVRQETMTSGKRGGLEENGEQRRENDSKEFDQPLFITVMLLSAYTMMALSFVPPQLHGPFGFLYTFLEALVRTNTNARYALAGGVLIHAGEALYARHLARKVDPQNVSRWVKSVFFYGLFSLMRLAAKANGKKAE